MKIAESSLFLSGRHQLREEYQRQESLRAWIGKQAPDTAEEGAERDAAVLIRLSPEAIRRQRLEPVVLPSAPIEETAPAAPPPPAEDPKLTAMRLVLEALTGKNIQITNFEVAESAGSDPGRIESDSTPSASPPSQGWGLEYHRTEIYTEQEATGFSASGVVRTEDGRTLDFTLDLLMTREFAAQSELHIRAGDALLIDPLVINFGEGATELGPIRFSFDLDSDGESEEISFVGANSGFLAFDRNQDGIINDGRELFGPASGRGFDELAAYDADGNGWLDEADPLFEKLRVWMKDAAGNDSLASLAEKNIGAIYLGSAATPFDLRGSGNALSGRIKESSIFLAESGRVGTIQEIDLAV